MDKKELFEVSLGLSILLSVGFWMMGLTILVMHLPEMAEVTVAQGVVLMFFAALLTLDSFRWKWVAKRIAWLISLGVVVENEKDFDVADCAQWIEKNTVGISYSQALIVLEAEIVYMKENGFTEDDGD